MAKTDGLAFAAVVRHAHAAVAAGVGPDEALRAALEFPDPVKARAEGATTT